MGKETLKAVEEIETVEQVAQEMAKVMTLWHEGEMSEGDASSHYAKLLLKKKGLLSGGTVKAVLSDAAPEWLKVLCKKIGSEVLTCTVPDVKKVVMANPEITLPVAIAEVLGKRKLVAIKMYAAAFGEAGPSTVDAAKSYGDMFTSWLDARVDEKLKARLKGEVGAAYSQAYMKWKGTAAEKPTLDTSVNVAASVQPAAPPHSNAPVMDQGQCTPLTTSVANLSVYLPHLKNVPVPLRGGRVSQVDAVVMEKVSELAEQLMGQQVHPAPPMTQEVAVRNVIILDIIGAKVAADGSFCGSIGKYRPSGVEGGEKIVALEEISA